MKLDIYGGICMRSVHCIRCGKRITEGEEGIRRKYFTGFYCSHSNLIF